MAARDDTALDTAAPDTATLQETIDYVAITRLQSAYADIVTRRAWGELADIFLPDADVVVDRRVGEPIVLHGPSGVGDFISGAIDIFEFFEFVILNTRVDIDGDTATARMYMQELRQDRGNGRWTNAYGLYQDRYQKRDGRWWFAGRQYSSLARTAPDTEVFPFPDML